MADRIRPAKSMGGVAGSREVGMNSQPPMMATTAIGMLTRKIEPQEKCSSSQPPLIGPTATPTPTMAAHSPIALARCAGLGEDIRDQRERGREDHRRADAHSGTCPDQAVRRAHLCRNGGGDRKQREPAAEKAASAEAVSQAACRQHQTGHDEGVGVDDPLQLAVSASSSRDSVGSATLTMVASTLTTKTLRQMTASAAIGDL